MYIIRVVTAVLTLALSAGFIFGQADAIAAEPLRAVAFSPAIGEMNVVPKPHMFDQLFIEFNQEISIDPTKTVYLGNASFQIENGSRISDDGRTLFLDPEWAFQKSWGFRKGEVITIRFEEGAVLSLDGAQSVNVDDWTFTITDDLTISYLWAGRTPSYDLFLADDDITAPGISPFIDDSWRTMVPLRMVSEGLGASVEWNEETRTVTIQTASWRENQVTIIFTIDSPTMTVNGNATTMDTVPVIIDPGYTFVPVRFVGEAFGLEVDFHQDTNTVLLIAQQ